MKKKHLILLLIILSVGILLPACKNESREEQELREAEEALKKSEEAYERTLERVRKSDVYADRMKEIEKQLRTLDSNSSKYRELVSEYNFLLSELIKMYPELADYVE